MTLPRFLALGACILTACTADAPAENSSAQVRRILSDDRYEWTTLESSGARIHFPGGSYAQEHQDVLGSRVGSARMEIARLLGQPGGEGVVEGEGEGDRVLHVFYVDSRADMEALTGAPVTGFSYFDDDAVILVFNAEWTPFERHELTHVVTLGGWPDPADLAVVEGLATYVQGQCGGYANGRVARAIQDREGMIPLDLLTSDFRRQNDLHAYLQAASLIEFLGQEEGVEIIPVLWERGLGAGPDLAGMAPSGFMEAFRDWLQESFEPVPDAALDAIRRGGCGISRPA